MKNANLRAGLLLLGFIVVSACGVDGDRGPQGVEGAAGPVGPSGSSCESYRDR